MKKYLFVMLCAFTLSGLFFSCSEDETDPKPTADFTFSPLEPSVGETVSFSATTSNTTSIEWSSVPASFSASSANPTHTFNEAGTYQITLKAKGPGGEVSAQKSITVKALAISVSSSFTFSPTAPEVGQAVQFTNTSTGAASFQWSSVPADFSSTAENPSFTFNTAQSYQITLVAKDAFGNEATSTQTLEVKAAAVPQPTVDFSFAPAEPTIGETVNFTSIVANATAFKWSSEPAELNATTENASYAFKEARTYSVTLEATGAGGATSVTKQITVKAAAVSSSFTFSPAAPEVGQAVQFTNTSTGAASFQWSSVPADFSSTAENPSFTFNTAQSYQITLVAKDAFGNEATSTQTLEVKAASTPTGDVCTAGNPCNLPLCFVSKVTTTASGVSTVASFEYKDVAGKKVVAKLTTTAAGTTITNTYDYDDRGRNIKITSITESALGNIAFFTEKIWDECKEIRNNSLDDNMNLVSYILFEYDAQGRNTKQSTFDANNNLTSYITFEDFTPEGFFQKQSAFDASGVLQTETTLTYQNCQVATTIGKDGAGNVVLDQRIEFDSKGLTSRLTGTNTISQGGINFTVNSVAVYEYDCE